VKRSNVVCGWNSNAFDSLVSRAETRSANRDGNWMLHDRWKNTSDKGGEMGGVGSR
jgi:hypothetical protein